MLVQIEIVIDLRFILGVIRTRDLWIRSPVRYPLRYEDCFIKYPLKGLPRSVTVRSRTGLRMQESWFWAWTWVHRKTHEEVFWLLTRTLTKFK